MNHIAINPNDFNATVSPGIVRKMIRGVLKMMASRLESQSIMKHHWELYCATAQHHVPYRVWQRHGAYLEMKYKSQLHE